MYNMALASSTTYFNIGDSSIIGSFNLKDSGELFEYSEAKEEDWVAYADYGLKDQYVHRVWVTRPWHMDRGFRMAKVLKTVAYILLDEDRDGNPVIEKWEIKKHNVYPRERKHFWSDVDRSIVDE